jgi:uncharacterized protein
MMASHDEIIKEILQTAHTIAIVGLSPSEDKPSNVVARYLQNAGYRVIPVNPGHEEILGEKSYGSLSAIPEEIDIVDIFMGSGKVVPVVEEAIRNGQKRIWLQLGIVNEDARSMAEKNGVTFVQDKCIKQEHERLVGMPRRQENP